MAIGHKAIEHYVEVVKSNQGIYSTYAIQTTNNMTVGGNLTVTGTITGGSEMTTSQVITAASANAFAVGATGTTNPQFNVDTSIASVATGLNIQGQAAGGGVTLSVLSSNASESLTIAPKGTAGGLFVNTAYIVDTSTGANALAVGPNGSTNPTFNVDGSVTSAATGLNVQGKAAGAGLAVTTLSSAGAENLTIDAKGTGTIRLNGTATGVVNIGTTSASLQVNGVIASIGEFLTDNQNQVAAASYAVSHTIFVNDNSGVTYKITNVSATFGTASASGTLQVEVATGTQAIGAGTTQLTGTVSLSGSANTAVNGTIVGSPTTIGSGNRINLIFAGTVTSLANCSIIVTMQRLA